MFLTILGISICLRANLGLFRELGGKKQKSAKPTLYINRHRVVDNYSQNTTLTKSYP